MKISKSQITALATRTKNAYSYSKYASWPAVAAALLRRGYTPRAAEAILLSKVMRWAVDQSTARHGRASASDLIRFMDKQPSSVLAVLREERLVPSHDDISDDEFWSWATREKPCRYCTRSFVGPCCPHCERP